MTGWQARYLVLATVVFFAATALCLFAADGLETAHAAALLAGALTGAGIAMFTVAVMCAALWLRETRVSKDRDERR